MTGTALTITARTPPAATFRTVQKDEVGGGDYRSPSPRAVSAGPNLAVLAGLRFINWCPARPRGRPRPRHCHEARLMAGSSGSWPAHSGRRLAVPGLLPGGELVYLIMLQA